MSKIERMSIMGIRSFGPDDSDRQIIQFSSPLTLIVGPNGTGKTTIIECLKYITTGELPPNAKGGAFVHDPKVAHETVVRGQVRLQMRDVIGNLLQVQRSMEATQKSKTIQTRTLDAVLTRLNAAGEKVSAAAKCIDYDREMVTAMGVSKAVLDNVIFCHQEDSCWPLSEGKALKDKFDAIFASTRYTKALETIRTLKQKKDATVKIYKEEIKYLVQHKAKATQLEGDLAELQAKNEASKDSIAKVKEQLQPVRERLTDIGQRYDEVYKVQTKIEKLKSQKAQMQTTVQDLQDNIENVFKGSTEQLEESLAKFASEVQDHKDSLSQLEDRTVELNERLKKLSNEKSKLLLEVGKLEQEAETQEDNIRKRDATIRTLAAEHGFEGFDRGTITDEKYQLFLEKMKQKMETLMEEVQNVKVDFEQQEAALQQRMDTAREKKTKLEQTQVYKKQQIDKNKAEIRQIRLKLSHMETSAGRLDHLIQELKSAERELADAENAVNLEELKKEIAQLDKERRQLESQKNDLDSEMSRLHLQSSLRAQLDMLKKDKTSKEDNIRRIKVKHEDSLTHLLGGVTTTNIRGRLDDYISSQTESVRRCSKDLQKAKTQLSEKEAEKTMLIKQIKEKEEEVRSLEERISGVCGSQNYEEGFQAVQDKLSEAQSQRGSLLGAEHFYKKYVRDLEKESPACPLCHRGFSETQEVRELVLELKNKLRMVPSKVEKADEDLSEHQKTYDDMVQLKPIKETLATLQDRDLPSLKTRLQKISEETQKLKQVIEEKSEELSMKEMDERMAKDMHSDIVLMDRYQGDLRELDKKIATQSGNLAGGDADRTLEVVVNEKEDIQGKLENVSHQLDRKRKKQSDHTDRVQKLQSQINSLQAEKLAIDSELQQRTTLEKTQAQLLSDNTDLEADIKEAREQLRPLEDEISRHRREKESVTSKKEAEVEQGKAEVDNVKSKGNGVKDINKTIQAYISAGKQGRLEKSRDRQRKIVSEQSQLQNDQEEVTANVNKMREILATQQLHEREMADNLQLRKLQKEIEELERQVTDFEKKLGGLDPRNLERERQKLLQKDDDLNKELHKATGRQQGYEDQIKATQRELNSPLFRDAAKKHREKMIELRTTELAINDLAKYYKAMDLAIMNYHTQKMADINMIIRELWRNTYRGNDIDTIEIRSANDDEESGAMKSRRVYNYRVVMLKGSTVLDMRGRCSAGQKMLASIIIRLALAETFCMNCGVFVLDEPTTNLDQENIDSLAHALVRIIEARAQRRSFQLVVITHDEMFVEKLGRSELSEYVWKVSKNENGNSRLNKELIQQFQHR